MFSAVDTLLTRLCVCRVWKCGDMGIIIIYASICLNAATMVGCANTPSARAAGAAAVVVVGAFDSNQNHIHYKLIDTN